MLLFESVNANETIEDLEFFSILQNSDAKLIGGKLPNKEHITNQIKEKYEKNHFIINYYGIYLSTNAMSNSTLDGVYVTTATKTEKV